MFSGIITTYISINRLSKKILIYKNINNRFGKSMILLYDRIMVNDIAYGIWFQWVSKSLKLGVKTKVMGDRSKIDRYVLKSERANRWDSWTMENAKQ